MRRLTAGESLDGGRFSLGIPLTYYRVRLLINGIIAPQVNVEVSPMNYPLHLSLAVLKLKLVSQDRSKVSNTEGMNNEKNDSASMFDSFLSTFCRDGKINERNSNDRKRHH